MWACTVLSFVQSSLTAKERILKYKGLEVISEEHQSINAVALSLLLEIAVEMYIILC